MKKKVCMRCKVFVEGDRCPLCKGNQLTTNWQGRVNVLHPSKSVIAKKMDISSEGEYVVKVR
ncbi:DNA-directed RNA polymerase subunit E'' [Candidatus Woesearchaeota archaeon CG08_land_8_20_14_0_20_47_9]|nr:MAG: DNA-directed RNA polymerase subunit E'' [Candidatus Woesearchaeota archaeon CG1_02_47_18]PIN72827.1 MAG: DNA-directed RNA polymerase subunit E'' [Candidatus Woesearchaeota archaeon CG10_big_fil_rev_8_21_14_0_10_47_5]PIO03393.1 MAG: DNA-directed RNA polymerase subunit E'' [Candidatus Woesearchaeota archaeon CG08_land_8_20_14_0_20_47_9]HII29575.1 DNA-directed RNA polymerase subunit E'' [Candidatus Woesearchaeota archaeon]